MRAFRYTCSVQVMWQGWQTHHLIFQSQKPTLHANFMALCCIEPELLTSEVCNNADFQPFLLLWYWLWPDDIHIRTWPTFPGDVLDKEQWTSYVKAIECYHLTEIHTYRQTQRQDWNEKSSTWTHQSPACIYQSVSDMSLLCSKHNLQ